MASTYGIGISPTLEKKRRRNNKKNANEIDRIAAAAKENGMSYGEYVARISRKAVRNDI